MASANKINELKKASRTLLDMLEANATGPDQVKVSIVPYTTRVNLGKSHKDAAWLTNQPTGSFMSGYNVPANRNAWQGCVADRDTGYNTAITPAGAVMQSRYPMVNCVDNLVEAMPLTSNFSQLRSRINAMNASGMTNIASAPDATPRRPRSMACDSCRPTGTSTRARSPTTSRVRRTAAMISSAFSV